MALKFVVKDYGKETVFSFDWVEVFSPISASKTSVPNVGNLLLIYLADLPSEFGIDLKHV